MKWMLVFLCAGVFGIGTTSPCHAQWLGRRMQSNQYSANYPNCVPCYGYTYSTGSTTCAPLDCRQQCAPSCRPYCADVECCQAIVAAAASNTKTSSDQSKLDGLRWDMVKIKQKLGVELSRDEAILVDNPRPN